MKAGFRAVSSPAVLIAHRTVILIRKRTNKQMSPWKVQNIRYVSNKLNNMADRELSNAYVISCHVMRITSLLAASFLGRFLFSNGGERSLIGITVQNPFNQATLILECTVPSTWTDNVPQYKELVENTAGNFSQTHGTTYSASGNGESSSQATSVASNGACNSPKVQSASFHQQHVTFSAIYPFTGLICWPLASQSIFACWVIHQQR